ncbi:MAG: hypothetical protein JNM75_06370 [Rhodospirillales bacterium]|nr:hypothetical protein [Rhodospirillales bacterium]
MATLGKALVALGVLTLAGAVWWWYAFFEQVFGHDVKKASHCFYYTSDTCSLASIVGYLGDIPTYSPLPFWVSIALMIIGVVLLAMTPLRS